MNFKKALKVLICVALITIATFGLCSCNLNIRESTDNPVVTIYVDKETGVNYYIFENGLGGGMTIRVNADGTPYVSEEE